MPWTAPTEAGRELRGATLGTKLIQLFGAVPEAWKRTSTAITTQCPDPNNPSPGTCTMHASSVDLSETLVALGKTPRPPTAPVFVPTPNHSHVVDDSRRPALSSALPKLSPADGFSLAAISSPIGFGDSDPSCCA